MNKKSSKLKHKQIAVEPMFFSEFIEEIPAVSKYYDKGLSVSSSKVNRQPNINSDGNMSSCVKVNMYPRMV
ncbi:hypothetical protein FGO68_gene5420 [Halteria grandinella]|uniref:Uncharacterized protein n=1 Tax=Halteria grandinella TaxID=5974 RepID=A0A8J8P6C4_HALGN|nr:hypothetical protein FGO68_gene5420 [Halteria grandinella]